VAILVAIGRQFYLDLRQLDLGELTWRPGWLLASGGLYFLALGCSAIFWYRLLWVFDQRPSFLRAMRAYYVGLLGKYLPGKAWALFIRGSLVSGPNVQGGVAIVTAFYEVFTTMASGALLAAVVFLIVPPGPTDLGLPPALWGLLILALLSVPLLPWFFNRLVGRLARRFQSVKAFRLPRLRIGTLLLGLVIMACAWVFFGLSLWSAVQALAEHPAPLTPAVLARYAAIMGLAYAGGFLVVVVPSGAGVREEILKQLLVPQLATQGMTVALVVLATLLLRVVWTATELVAAGVLWLIPDP